MNIAAATGNPADADAWSIMGYGHVEALRMRSLPAPVPERNDLLVEVEATALNPLDLKLIDGDLRSLMPVAFPFVPGADVCGHIVALGPDVAGYKIGDRVVGMSIKNGGMARYAIIPEGPSTTYAPQTTAASDLAAIPEAGLTALAIVRAAEVHPGSSVLIVGATGGIGLFLCQLLAQDGVYVIATAGSKDEGLVRFNGARETVDYTTGSAADLTRNLRPQGVDVAVDLINVDDGLFTTARAVKKGGKLISTLHGPDISKFPNEVVVSYIRLSVQPGDLDRLVRGVSNGSLRSNVTAIFAFAETVDSYLALRDGHVSGKIVVQT